MKSSITAPLFFLLAFALASIGGDGCFGDWSTPPAAPPSPTTACPSGEQRFTCAVTIRGLRRGACGIPGMTCDASMAWTPCASSLSNGVTKTQQIAAMNVDPTLAESGYDPPACSTFTPDTPIADDLTPTTVCACVPTISPVCTANNDACSTDMECCSSICSEQGACEACRADGEGCTTDGECCGSICALNACSGNGLRLHDGGLGFGGDSP